MTPSIPTHEDVDRLNAVRLKLLKFQLDISDLFIGMIAEIKAERYPRPAQCDIGWAFREIAKIADEIRKEAKARQELVGQILALRMTEDVMNDMEALAQGDSLTVRGRFASGTPDVKQQAALPRSGSKEYSQLCNALGLADKEVIESGLVQFSFRKLGDYVSKFMAEGRQIPEGITKTYPLYSTIFRTKKGKN